MYNEHDRRDSPVVTRSSVKQEDPWCAFNQPPSVDKLDTSVSHSVERVGERRSGLTVSSAGGQVKMRQDMTLWNGMAWDRVDSGEGIRRLYDELDDNLRFFRLDLHGCGLVRERTDEACS